MNSKEVLFGLEVGARVALGEGLTAKVALGGFLHATYNGRLYENGQLTDVGINDTMKDILNEIERLLGLPSNNKKVGAKALFNLLKLDDNSGYSKANSTTRSFSESGILFH